MIVAAGLLIFIVLAAGLYAFRPFINVSYHALNDGSTVMGLAYNKPPLAAGSNFQITGAGHSG